MSVLQGEGVQMASNKPSDKEAIAQTLTPKKTETQTPPSQTAIASAAKPAVPAAVDNKESTQVARAPAPSNVVSIKKTVQESQKNSKNNSLTEFETEPKQASLSTGQETDVSNIDPRNKQQVASAIAEISRKQNVDPNLTTTFAVFGRKHLSQTKF
jgi:hypothetical protein